MYAWRGESITIIPRHHAVNIPPSVARCMLFYTGGLRPNPSNAPITKLYCANLKERCLYYSGGHTTSSADSCNSGALISIFNLKKETCRQLESPDGKVIDFICLPTSPYANGMLSTLLVHVCLLSCCRCAATICAGCTDREQASNC